LTIILRGENEQKGGKMQVKRNKNASGRRAESAQLEKNNFTTEKKYFSNREIKFSQLAVSDFPAGFTSNCFFVKFFCIGNYVGKVFLG
jgi:hypothetical protein